MDTSIVAVKDAIMKHLKMAGEVGLYLNDLMGLIGCKEKSNILPRLYQLQDQKLVKRLDNSKWKVAESNSSADDASNCTHSSKVFCRDNFISYKNTLQEYCQKRHLPMPLYQFEKTDYGFKATVQFDQKVYSSQTCQPSVKDAEKRVAFEALKIEQVLPSNAIFGMTVQIELPTKKRKSPGLSSPDSSKKPQLVEKEEGLSMKNRLQEEAQKSKLDMPEYQVSGSRQSFMASVSFRGQVFSSTRKFQKKKMAEHNAAHVALFKLGYVSNPPVGLVPQQSSSTGSSSQGKQSSAKNASSTTSPHENYKNKLQECMQRKKAPMPKYETIHQKDKDSSGFLCTVTVEGAEYGSSLKSSKKEAEKDAACVALDSLGLTT